MTTLSALCQDAGCRSRKPYFWGPILFCSGEILGAQRSVRVLDTKPMGLRVRTLPASLPCVLEQDPLTNPCLVLGQPRKTRPDITKKKCVLRSKDSKSSKLWLEGVRSKSLAENKTMSSCMSHGNGCKQNSRWF